MNKIADRPVGVFVHSADFGKARLTLSLYRSIMVASFKKWGRIMPNYRNESTERLFAAVAALRTPEECAAFFDDLCTIKEIRDMAQRLDTALLLDQGRSYQQIAEQVGISTATISRVNRCLSYGAGGYRAVIDRMKEENA